MGAAMSREKPREAPMMTTPSTPETSVLVSLSELAEIEEERIREEEMQHARARAERDRERRLSLERHREEEAQRLRTERQARAQREQQRAEARARAEARRQAAVEVARIEAEAKARLEAENVMRAHELALLRARSEGGSRRLQRVLGAALGLVLCAGAGLGYHLQAQVTQLEGQALRLSAGQRSAEESHRRALKATLTALERRQAILAGRGAGAVPEQVLVAGRIASEANDGGALAPPKLESYREALDAWQVALDRRGRLTQLDARRADLVAWAAAQRQAERADAARAAGKRARAANADEAALDAYESALDDLRQALRSETPRRGPVRRAPTEPSQPTRICTNPHDPMCGLDGKPL